MSQKLTGKKYRDYWSSRAAAQGPNYVGQIRDLRDPDKVVAQANRFWTALQAALPKRPINDVTEFGCGWGRMAIKLAEHYPKAHVRGIEMIERSIKHGQTLYAPEEVEFFNGDHYCAEIPPCDLLVTCTALQHVTDPMTWKRVVTSFYDKVRPRGWLIMLENDLARPRSSHMTDRCIDDYIEAFHGFEFGSANRYPGRTLDREAHAVIAMRRNEE